MTWVNVTEKQKERTYMDFNNLKRALMNKLSGTFFFCCLFQIKDEEGLKTFLVIMTHRIVNQFRCQSKTIVLDLVHAIVYITH